MQFLTAKSVLYIRLVILLFITYTLSFNPASISSIGYVILLGQAMDLKLILLQENNPLIGVLVILFTYMIISDLIPLLSENLDYFNSIIPIRTMLFFIIGAYSYLIKSSVLSNNLIFTYAFLEIWLNFLIYNNLRDEKYYRMKKFVEENADEIKKMEGDRVIPIPRNE